MRKNERDAFDKLVLRYIKAKGTVNTNQVARHFNKKWETANTSISRLVRRGEVYYLPEMGDNPSFYSIWPDAKGKRTLNDTPVGQPAVSKLESKRESNDTYARFDVEYTRAEVPTQVLERGGFVCHPSARGSDLPSTFVRAHIHGQYLVKIITIGVMPNTYIVPNTEITGGWTSRQMGVAGNKCYYGHIKFPEDKTKYKFHSMADKDGCLTSLSVYVHPRYIYYKGNAGTAMIEFEEQVKDVLRVLEGYGWEFGEIIRKGYYSMGYNNRSYAEQMPKDHTEKESDPVKFDSSPGESSKGCTEAEIYGDDALSQEQMEALVEHPQRILDLEAVADDQAVRIDAMDKKLDKLVTVAEKNLHLTELTMTAQIGPLSATDVQPASAIEPVSAHREDVMYG